jgi:hypothetical protein
MSTSATASACQVGHERQKRVIGPTGSEGAGDGLEPIHVLRHPARFQGAPLGQLQPRQLGGALQAKTQLLPAAAGVACQGHVPAAEQRGFKLAGRQVRGGLLSSYTYILIILHKAAPSRETAGLNYLSRVRESPPLPNYPGERADEIRPQYVLDAPDANALFASDIVRANGVDVGSTINQLDNAAITDLYSEWALALPSYSDQVLPFNVTLAGANEYGAMCAAKILGIEILNEGSGMSVDDAVSESQATFVALAIEPLQAVNSPLHQVPPPCLQQKTSRARATRGPSSGCTALPGFPRDIRGTWPLAICSQSLLLCSCLIAFSSCCLIYD